MTSPSTDKETVRLNTISHPKEISDLGVNTDRIALVPNVHQSSYIPTQVHKAEERAESGSSSEKDGSNEELGSSSNEFVNIKTKYSMKTIQPTVFDQKMSFMILTASVDYKKEAVG